MFRWLTTLTMLVGFGGLAQARPVVVFESPKRSSVLDVSASETEVVVSLKYTGSLTVSGRQWASSQSAYMLMALGSTGEIKWAKPVPVAIESLSHSENVIYVSGRGGLSGGLLGCTAAEVKPYSAFVAQLTKDGHCTWLVQVSSLKPVMVSDLASQAGHGVVLVGNADAALSVLGQDVPVPHRRAFYALRLSSRGEKLWMRTSDTDVGGLFGASAWAVAMGDNGVVAVGGNLSGTTRWLGQTLSSGSYLFEEGAVPKAASFVSVIGEDGEMKWSRVVSTRTQLQGLAMGAGGTVFAVGGLDGDGLLVGDGFGPKHPFVLGAYGNRPSSWLTAFDSMGTVLWMATQTFKGDGQTVGVAVKGETVVSVGFARGTLRAGGKIWPLTPDGAPDMFMALYGLDGRFVAIELLKGPGKTYASALSAHRSGLGVVAGTFQGSLKVGDSVIHSAGKTATNGFLWISR
jgi:hypothetical protein